MNYLMMTLLLVLTNSCSNESAAENEDLKAVNVSSAETITEPAYLELALHQNYLEGKLIYLEAEKARLMEEIEGGNEALAPELEAVQQAIRDARELAAVNEEVMGGITPIRPPRPMPNPCGDPDDEMNCPVYYMEGERLILWILEDQGEVEVIAKDPRGEVVGEVVEIESHPEIDGVQIYTLEITANEIILEVNKENLANGAPLSYGSHFAN